MKNCVRQSVSALLGTIMILTSAEGGIPSYAATAGPSDGGSRVEVLHGAAHRLWLGRALALDEVSALSDWLRGHGKIVDVERVDVATAGKNHYVIIPTQDPDGAAGIVVIFEG